MAHLTNDNNNSEYLYVYYIFRYAFCPKYKGFIDKLLIIF